MPNLGEKLQLWYIAERREYFTSHSAEVIDQVATNTLELQYDIKDDRGETL